MALPVPEALYAVCGLSLPEHCALPASKADVQSDPAAAIEAEAETVRALLKVRGLESPFDSPYDSPPHDRNIIVLLDDVP